MLNLIIIICQANPIYVCEKLMLTGLTKTRPGICGKMIKKLKQECLISKRSPWDRDPFPEGIPFPKGSLSQRDSFGARRDGL